MIFDLEERTSVSGYGRDRIGIQSTSRRDRRLRGCVHGEIIDFVVFPQGVSVSLKTPSFRDAVRIARDRRVRYLNVAFDVKALEDRSNRPKVSEYLVETLLGEVYEMSKMANTDQAIDKVFDFFDEALSRSDFAVCNAVLKSVNVDRFDIDILVAFLVISFGSKENLRERGSYYSRVHEHVALTHSQDEVTNILLGLE